MKAIDLLERATGGRSEIGAGEMPASAGRALILGDPALIWLDHFADRFTGLDPDPKEYSFMEFLGNKGREFEKKWIAEMAPKALHLLANDWDCRKTESIQQTLEAMDRKEPCIAKAALAWHPQKVYGACDLCVTNEWLYEAFPALKPKKPERLTYVIIDLKMTSNLDSPQKAEALQIASDQVRIYSYIVGHLQNYMPKRAYLFTRDRVADPIIVEVNQELNKPLSPELRKRRREYLHIRQHGGKLRPWKDDEVRPNFANESNGVWNNAKKEIEVNRIPGRSLTLLAGIGPKLAQALTEKGWASLDSLLRVKPETLPLEEVDGIGEIMAKRIRAVLKANRDKVPTPIPSEVELPNSDVVLFADTEFFNGLNVNYDTAWPANQGNEMIWAIGIGWMDGRKWCYKQLTAPEESAQGERKLLKEFADLLRERGALDSDKTVSIYHWTQAEPLQMRRAAERHKMKYLDNLPWFDLYKVYADGPVGIPGAFDFGLKSIATAIGEYDKRFRSEWKDEMSGLQAMVCAWAAYAQKNPLDSAEMIRLRSYLSADVAALRECARFIKDAKKPVRKADAHYPQAGWYAGGFLPVRYAQPDATRASGWYGRL